MQQAALMRPESKGGAGALHAAGGADAPEEQRRGGNHLRWILLAGDRVVTGSHIPISSPASCDEGQQKTVG